MTVDLAGKSVLLSASIPTEERRHESGAYRPSEIANAVSALARTILTANGNLVCGGHPAITPLLLWIARESPARNAITVFQSEHFRDEIPPETTELAAEGFGEVIWTEAGDDRRSSLLIMRQAMLGQDISAVVYIGGMDGIIAEFELARNLAPAALQVPLVAPGGSARRLLDRVNLPAALTAAVQTRRYPYVASLIAETIDQR